MLHKKAQHGLACIAAITMWAGTARNYNMQHFLAKQPRIIVDKNWVD